MSDRRDPDQPHQGRRAVAASRDRRNRCAGRSAVAGHPGRRRRSGRRCASGRRDSLSHAARLPHRHTHHLPAARPAARPPAAVLLRCGRARRATGSIGRIASRPPPWSSCPNGAATTSSCTTVSRQERWRSCHGRRCWGYPAPDRAAIDATKRKYRLAGAFAYFPAHTFPHKNHLGLLGALARLRDEAGLEIPLVCSGRRNEFYRVIHRRVRDLGLTRQVRFLGFVSPAEVNVLYPQLPRRALPHALRGLGTAALRGLRGARRLRVRA